MIRYSTNGPVATITIDDSERRNALTNEAMTEMGDALKTACADGDVRVVVVTGAGDRVFSAGGDLSGGFVDAPLAGHGERGALADLIRGMRRCPKPVIARVNGPALGGGLGLVAGCDIAIAAEHATFGTPEIAVGLWPMMITAVLRPLVPRRPLLEMMLTGRRFGAVEAAELGIINRVVLGDELDNAVGETVDALVSQSPAALALGKAAFYAVEDMDLDTALDHLHIGLTAVATTEDAAEGVRAFLDKRDPSWKGR
ncbi:MAG: enoyl-CoA hydratase-related protein [Actinomycetota bacterium]|nr:enoyl-CoA hydratase-related protein [Actinomycetota bacterium]